VKTVRIWQKAHPDLDNAALEALRQWTFDPFIGKDKPAAGSFFMTVDYKLPVSVAPAGSGENKKEKTGAMMDETKRK
jgi:hypothetical protein